MPERWPKPYCVYSLLGLRWDSTEGYEEEDGLVGFTADRELLLAVMLWMLTVENCSGQPLVLVLVLCIAMAEYFACNISKHGTWSAA